MFKTKQMLLLVALLIIGQDSYRLNARPVDLRPPLSRVSFDEIYNFAQISADAYDDPDHVRREHPNASWVSTPGHTHVQYFVLPPSEARYQVVAVRGSVDSVNWSTDKDTYAVFDNSSGIVMHHGFGKVSKIILKDLKLRLRADRPLVLTGHSLGGAVAAILAIYLHNEGYKVHRVYTFGQPKFTDANGAHRYQHIPILRIINQNDIVPMWPNQAKGSSTYFAHLGPEVILLSGPHLVFIAGPEATRRSVGELRHHLFQASVPDHKMKWYLKAVRAKLEGVRIVPYAKREQYVSRHRPGSAANYREGQTHYNFRSHHF